MPDPTPSVTDPAAADELDAPRLHREGTAEVWRLPDGRTHRLDGPAVVDRVKDTEEWWAAGARHRLDGPAYTSPTMRGWWLRGYRHRDVGPACENLSNGVLQWYEHGARHRVGGPAATGGGFPDEWWERGQRHRLDGPAVIGGAAGPLWYVRGAEVWDTDPLHELYDTGRIDLLELTLTGWTPDGPQVRDLIAAVHAAHA